jgi:hypothetical protein
MNQSISILELVLLSVSFVLGYAFIKTLVETIKNK